MERPIVDAASFYQSIKQNSVFTPDDDREAVDALQAEFEALLQACREANMSEERLYATLFFQGRIRGMKTMNALHRHHYEIEMRKQEELDRKARSNADH